MLESRLAAEAEFGRALNNKRGAAGGHHAMGKRDQCWGRGETRHR